MTLSATFLYDQPTGILHKSAHFIVESVDGFTFRHYEEAILDKAVNSAIQVPAFRTPQFMWDNSIPLTGMELRKFQFLRSIDQAHAQIAATLLEVGVGRTATQSDQATLSGTPTQAQVLSVVRRMADREVALLNRIEQELNREDQEIIVLERIVRQLMEQNDE